MRAADGFRVGRPRLRTCWPTGPGGRARRYIDGVATNKVEITYDSADDAIGESFLVELRYGERAVAQFRATLSETSCLGRVDNPSRYRLSLCSYASGDLRFQSDSAFSDSRSCIGDGFCHAICSCGLDRCTSRITSREPFASHLGCAPVGPKALGEACALIADADGDYDDCGSNLLCVDGRVTSGAACRAVQTATRVRGCRVTRPRSTSASSSLRVDHLLRHPAVDDEDLTGHEARLARRQIGRHRGDVLGTADAADRMLLVIDLSQLGLLALAAHVPRIGRDPAGRDRVDAHVGTERVSRARG